MLTLVRFLDKFVIFLFLTLGVGIGLMREVVAEQNNHCLARGEQLGYTDVEQISQAGSNWEARCVGVLDGRRILFRAR